MKKIKYLILLLGLLIIPAFDVHASSASISCSSAGTVTVGNRVTVTFTGNYSGNNRDMLMWRASGVEWTSSKLNANFSNSAIGEDGTLSRSYSFTATNVGTATVRLVNVDVADGDQLIGPGGVSNSCTINIVAPSPSSNSHNSSSSSSSSSSKNNINDKDSDNSLKSLSIDDQKLNPEFNKDTLEYSVELENNVEKIKINAEATSSKSSIKGTGEIDVKEGLNKIEVVVTAENGSTRTYIINATVKEKDPIKVKVAGKGYTIVRKLDGLKIPTTFTEKEITISNEKINACYNDNINYTLVALKDENNNIRFYIYNEGKNTYSKFNMISSADLNVIVLKLDDKDDIPYRYSKTVFNYNDDSIDGYSYGNTDFKVIYGINAITGEEGLYQYDTKDNTIQRFFNEQTNLYVNLVQKLKLAFIILGSVILIFTIIIIILLSKNVKFKKKYLSTRLNDIDEPNYNKIKYEDIEENKEELEEELSKKELKKLKKEEKRKEKSEKTFLD